MGSPWNERWKGQVDVVHMYGRDDVGAAGQAVVLKGQADT